MSGQQETAEEVTQEVFLTLLAESRKYLAERGDLQALPDWRSEKQSTAAHPAEPRLYESGIGGACGRSGAA